MLRTCGAPQPLVPADPMSSDDRLNIQQFASGPFKPHGRVELWTEGNVVYLEASGPFNKEAVLAVGATWRELFARLPHSGPFADVVVVEGSMMAGPEVLEAFGAFLGMNTAANVAPCAVAWVVPPAVEGGVLMIPAFEQIYQAAGRNIRFFDNLPQARDWVRGQLRLQTPLP